MSTISKDKQNLNENQFRPDFGTDDNGIQYSCGHINPLQRALVNNGVEKLNAIKESLLKAITDIDNFSNEILEFAKVRCEEVREVNSELRSALDNYECSCEPDYDNCPYCERKNDAIDDLESDKADLEEKIVELKDKKEELENALLESNVKIQEILHSFNNLEKL
jgi:hypothetical protein